MLARTALLLATTSIAACGAPATDDPLKDLPPGCEQMLSQCLGIQQICADGPVCQPCPDGQYAASNGVCRPIGTPITHDFAMFTADGGEEILGLCQSWTLNNPTELWINAVELDQDEASHHSNWLFVPDDKYNGPDGVWPCADRSYDQLAAALAGGVLYAQSTQAHHEVQKFPNGAAVRIPPYSRIISDVHILNATPQPVTGHARLSIYPLDAGDLKIRLTPFHQSFDALEIPPEVMSRSAASCDVEYNFQVAFNHQLDAKVYYILPHFHALGRHFYVSRMGGQNPGQVIFDAVGADGEARGTAFDPPIDLTGDDGLTFGCDFKNATPLDVHYGFGDQEMCELLGFADSALAWDASVMAVHSDAAQDGLPTYTGSCNTFAFKYDFNKPGGPGPQ